MHRPLLLIAFLAAGCAQDPAAPSVPPPEPMAITGPNEVVILVPGMVCESCPKKVAEGLALLSWVEIETIHPDRKLKQVRFRVNDRASFDPEVLMDTISRKGFKGVQVLVGPT